MPRARKKASAHFTRIIALAIVLLLLLSIVVAGLFPLIANAEQIDFELHVAGMAVQVSERIHYVNDTGGFLDQVLLNAFANAYRRSGTVPVEPDDFEDAYPSAFTAGGVEFYQVLVDGAEADFGLSGGGEGNLRVACSLEPGEAADITLIYDVALPSGRTALGANEDELRLLSFNPSVAVYDEAQAMFLQYPPSPHRQMDFSEVADYSASITVPPGFSLIAPGDTQKTGENAYTVEASGVRALPLIIKRGGSMRTVAGAAGTAIDVSAPDMFSARRAATYADRALAFFSGKLGAYPLASLKVTSADVLTAQSYMGMIVLPDHLFKYAERAALEREIAFHVARQYFGLLCANDPQLEPWLDDSLCSYAELLYIEHIYGRKAFLSALNDRVLDALKITLPGYVYVDSATTYFSSALEYRQVIMERGAAVMHEVRGLLGDEAFFEALRLYVASTRGKTASIGDMFSALSEASGRDVSYFLMEMLRTIGDYVNQNLESYGE